MVNYGDPALDRMFAALADPTRRAMLAKLRRKSLSVSELARPFDMSLPAVIKHLDVLSEAGLVRRAKTGRTVACTLNAAPMARADRWLNHYRSAWEKRLDRFSDYLQELQQT